MREQLHVDRQLIGVGQQVLFARSDVDVLFAEAQRQRRPGRCIGREIQRDLRADFLGLTGPAQMELEHEIGSG